MTHTITLFKTLFWDKDLQINAHKTKIALKKKNLSTEVLYALKNQYTENFGLSYCSEVLK